MWGRLARNHLQHYGMSSILEQQRKFASYFYLYVLVHENKKNVKLWFQKAIPHQRTRKLH